MANHQTRFHFYRNGARLSAAPAGEASVTVITANGSLSVLIAEGCTEDQLADKLFLKGVTQLIIENRTARFEEFPMVCLHAVEDEWWLAEECENLQLISRQASVPFFVSFVPRAAYRELMAMAERKEVAPVLEFADRQAGGPADSFARAVVNVLDQNLKILKKAKATVRIPLPPKPHAGDTVRIALPPGLAKPHSRKG